MTDRRTSQRTVAHLLCGKEQGTATIVAPTIAIATRHSVIDHLETSAPIELRIPELADSVTATLHFVSVPIDEDIVLLELATAVDSVVDLSATHLPVGDEWQAFGYPQSRKAGSWIDGTVATWLPQGTQPQDVELSVTNFHSLRSYQGYSGAPVWVAGRAVAFLQRQLNGGLAATSVLRLRRYLDAAGVEYRSAQGLRSAPPSLRPAVDDARPNTQTYWAFENALRDPASGYTVLAGAPGSGKTIIAAAFTPEDRKTRIIGTYFAGGDADPAGLQPELQRDPSAFAGWLAQETALVTGDGVPSHSTDGARAHAVSIEKNFAALAGHFKSQALQGLIIIDDMCGLVAGVIDRSLARVLPKTPPAGLAIALTAASEAIVRASAPHLQLGTVILVTPLEQYDCERIVAEQLRDQPSVQSTDMLRLASASNGNPLILSYLIREVRNAISAKQPLPATDAPVPTAKEFYDQQWARLNGNDTGMWLVALVARLRGRLPEVELSSVLPEAVQVGLPTAWSAVGHLLRRERDGVEVFHSSFRDYVIAQTNVLNLVVHDRLADYCARETSEYSIANRVYHHLLASPSKQELAADLFTQEWLDSAAGRSISPAYILADLDNLLDRALANGSLNETIRLLLARSRLRFRYGNIFGKYSFELACVVSPLRGVRKAMRFIVHDERLLCSPAEAVAFIRRLILAEEYEAAVDVYEALRRMCFAQYETGEVTWMSWHLETLGLLLGELGPSRMGEMKMLYRVLDRAVGEDGADTSAFKTAVSALPASSHLWRWGWFVQSVRYRDSDRARYVAELVLVIEHAHEIACIQGRPKSKVDPPPPTNVFKIFTPSEAAAELEWACRGTTLRESIASSAITILMRHGRDPLVVQELASVLSSVTVQLRQPNGVDAAKEAVHTLIRVNAIAEYIDDHRFRQRVSPTTRGQWEQRFLDAAAWLGSTHGRLCRARRNSDALELDLSPFLKALTFSLADRSSWTDSYALPESLVPLLLARLCEVVVEFSPRCAGVVGAWALGNADGQLGLYTEGCRAAMWELAEGVSFCDIPTSRALWRAHLAHVLTCTSNREERVAALLACGQGAMDIHDSELAEEALSHAVRASMGPSWYKEDQLTLLVDVLNAADSPAITNTRWPDVVGLLEHASGDLTFQRFIRYEKESLVRHLSKGGRLGEALALTTSYLWPDETTQLARIQSWRADRVTPIDGGRWGCSEIDPQAAALALLEGLADAPARHRWAVVELFLPGDERHFSSFAKLVSTLFGDASVNQIQDRLLHLLVADFAPEKRRSFVKQLRDGHDKAVVDWLDGIQAEHEWARLELHDAETPSPIAPAAKPAPSSDFLYAPGMFGRPEGHRVLDEAVRDGAKRRAIGDLSGARDRIVDGLTAAQSAGWGIWHANSEFRAALRELFVDTTDAAATVRALRGVILDEEHAVDWQIAEALIDSAVPKREEALVAKVVDEVFAHTRAMLAPELAVDVEYELGRLAKICQPRDSSHAIVLLLIESLDDACCHFRDRAASVLRWLLVTESGADMEPLLSPILERVNSAAAKHSKELCVGIIHSWFIATPAVARGALVGLPAFILLHSNSSLAVRYVASQIEGTAIAANTVSQISQTASLTHHWRWQTDCAAILDIGSGNSKAPIDAEQQLSVLCGELDPWTVAGLWRLRRTAVASKDFWSNPYEREAAWRAASSGDVVRMTELFDQLMWNPQWPDATLDPSCNGVANEIFERIQDGRLEDCFVVAGRLLLHCREATFDERTQTASQLEIVALMVPSAYFTGEFDRDLLYERRSTHGPLVSVPSILAGPVEPAVAKFEDRRGSVGGSMTPALPSQRLLEVSRRPQNSFIRTTWRDGREWEPVGVGRPLRDGTLLTAEPDIATSLAGIDLAWCLLRNGKRVALVDVARRKVFRGDNL